MIVEKRIFFPLNLDFIFENDEDMDLRMKVMI